MLCGEGVKLPLDLLIVELPLSISVKVPGASRLCGRTNVLFQVNCHLLTDLTEPLNLECNLKSKYINFDEMELLMKQTERSWLEKNPTATKNRK